MLVDNSDGPVFDVLGPTVQFLAETGEGDEAPCIMRGTIPPGVVIPLHSHPDPETFLARSGELEGLAADDGELNWVPIAPGAVFHVPPGVPHAFRNGSDEPAVQIIVTTARLGRFLREVGTPVAPGAPSGWPPAEEALQRMLATAARYGHWTASPAENERVGLALG